MLLELTTLIKEREHSKNNQLPRAMKAKSYSMVIKYYKARNWDICSPL